MPSKKVLITGITGQDGSYLAEFLLHKGYEVHGIIRRSSTFNTARIDHIHTYSEPNEPPCSIFLHYGDLSNSEQISNIIYNIGPDEVYNLGSQSHVRVSFDMPEYTIDIGALGAVRILEIIRRCGNKVKYYQASSSEMFGSSAPPQNEQTQLKPRSPYAIAKGAAYWATVNYRDGYGIFACNGILFNHESPRRGETFVTRKVTHAIPDILSKKQRYLYLGNLYAKRDWGYAPEYCMAMWEIMQQPKPDDFVLGLGEPHTVQEFVKEAFNYVDLNYEDYVRTDQRYFRPTEADELYADSRKAQKAFNWNPRIKFKDLVKIMVDADMRKAGLEPIGEGDEILKKTFKDRWWKID